MAGRSGGSRLKVKRLKDSDPSASSTVTVSVRDARASESDRLWIESVYRDYLDDLAPLNTGIFPVLGEVGHREPDQITRWFSDSTAHVLAIGGVSQPGRDYLRPWRDAFDAEPSFMDRARWGLPRG